MRRLAKSEGHAGRGVNRQLPHLGDMGQGVNRQRPHLDAGQGVKRSRPPLGTAGQGVNRQPPHLGDGEANRLTPWFEALSERLSRVRVCCGDWARVVTATPTTHQGVTAVFLDPPYSQQAGRDNAIYSREDLDVATAVRTWAIEHGDDPRRRIALCGYEGEHAMPDSWECVGWKTQGGMANQSDGRGKANARRERIWFSPHCKRPSLRAMQMF